MPRWLKTCLLLSAFTIGYVFLLLVPAGAMALIVNGDCGLARTAQEARDCNDGMLRTMLIVYGIGALLYPLLVRTIWVAFGTGNNIGRRM